MALDPGRQFLISPPFGTYIRHPRAYSVLGSYTVDTRRGRVGRIIKTVRPVPSDFGPAWINKIGLRNPGVRSIRLIKPHQIVSLAPLADRDWHALERWIDERAARGYGQPLIEFNVSCPNVDEHPSIPHRSQLIRIFTGCSDAIFKLPPIPGSIDASSVLHEAGVKYIHLSNTYPTPIGGVSGAPLREVNLPLVAHVARALPSITIIAGGGIYRKDDVVSYLNAGATMFSVSSAFFKPWRGFQVLSNP